MSIFQIIDWSLSHKQNGRGIKMGIVLKRKIVGEILTTYFPTILLISITFATTSFKPFFFEAALSVNLTTMLVMTTIFMSKMESLPPTSDIKMIDIWLVFCQLVPFTEVVLLTVMEYNRDENTKSTKKKSRKGRKRKKNEKKATCIVVVPKEDNGDIHQQACNRDAKGISQLLSKLRLPCLKTVGNFPKIACVQFV